MLKILAALLLITSTAQAQPSPRLVEKSKYEETLKHYVSWNKNLSEPDFYKKFVWEGKDVKKFCDLSDFEKDQVYLIQGFKLTREINNLRLAWDNEILWLKSGKATIPENAATAEEVEEFQKQLFKLQKETAVAFEKLIDTVFKKHEALIPKKERDFIKKQIVKFHDSLELIKRK